MKPYNHEALNLLHQGAIAFAEIEKNGIRIDTDYIESAIKDTRGKINGLKEELEETDVVKTWRRKFGRKTNLGSDKQLGKVLFHYMDFPIVATTKSGAPKTDESTLATIDDPFIKKHLEIKKMEKAIGTNFKGILRETVDGYLHPFFNLHTAQTYRSSSADPNFQNIPVRNKTIGPLIRKAFVPRPGRRLIEIDYRAIEVRIAACYHNDPAMIDYICDESKDMHRDQAIECFMLKPGQVTKEARYCGKNMFVFPQFYGDWYIDCARSLWDAITSMSLMTGDGLPMMEHLERQGIYDLGALDPNEKPIKGTFEHHIWKVERNFWEKRFPVYSKWKKDWYKDYQEMGWFLTKTGFICSGFMKRNEVINYPVQGSAFHCLLWAVIRIQKELRKRKMKTLIVGQIHDSIVADVPENEYQEFLILANRIMTEELVKQWDWIIVPIAIEAEATPIDGNWAQKEEVPIPFTP